MSPFAADGQRTTSSSSPAEEVSVSTVAAAAIGTGYHLFKVEGYSRLKHTHGKNGSYLMSSAFKAAGKIWRIRCYFNGLRAEDAGFMSLLLELLSGAGGSVVHTEFEFELVSHSHQALSPPHSMRAPPTPLCDAQHWAGYPQFISREALEGSTFLEDDCFAVRCRVTVVEERAAARQAVQAQDIKRMGLRLCKCDDDKCKLHHPRPAQTISLREAFAWVLSFICSL